MIHLIRQMTPKFFLDLYHHALSWLAAAWYGNPSREMIVVGVTGTNGKTTTTYLTAKALEASGHPTGCTTTALFKIAEREWLNDTKMTMLGRFALQRLLREMVEAGCRYAVIETSSQGIVQHRHRGIAYDVSVFTNLTPEHLEAHGGFEKYKATKIELFRHVAHRPVKRIEGQMIPKIAILNCGNAYAKEFALPGFDRIVWYGIGHGDISATEIQETAWEISFSILGQHATLKLLGRVNIENAIAGIATASALGIPLDGAIQKLEEVTGIPGRFERIDEGQPFTVIVDYAPEPYALARCYEAIEKIPHERFIHVLGSAGGGRDVARRPILGRMAAEHADVVIITNEDPYDDDPQTIIEQVAEGVRAVESRQVEILTILDRREAIRRAMREARPGDLVLLTGKGCEQAIMGPRGSRFSWDERTVAREEIRAIL